MVDKAPLVGGVRTGQVTTVLGSHSLYTQWTTYYSSLTCTNNCRLWWRPGTSTSTITHTSYRSSSSTDGVPSVTGVGGYVGGCIVWDHSIRQRTQCGAGSCGGWGLVGHRQYSQHSLKVTHLVSVPSFLTQQCSPSGLKCVGPRCRTTAPKAALMNSSSLTAALSKIAGTVPPGNSHPTPALLLL